MPDLWPDFVPDIVSGDKVVEAFQEARAFSMSATNRASSYSCGSSLLVLCRHEKWESSLLIGHCVPQTTKNSFSAVWSVVSVYPQIVCHAPTYSKS